MKVVIAGEDPFVTELARLCQKANHDLYVYLIEDFMDAMHSGTFLEDADQIDVVIELHNESAAAKQELLLALTTQVGTNSLVLTSALATSSTQAASWVLNPERVVGFGILPPLTDEGLVELAAGIRTSTDAMERAKQFWQSLNYEPVVVKDGVGLVRARTVCCIINEAITALMEGVATAADIDQAMRLGTNYPHGPLEWADHIGLDAVYGIMSGLYAEWGEDRYRPAPLLRHKVLAGQLGKKTGEGFYQYK